MKIEKEEAAENQMPIEEAFAKLSDIVEQMESPEITLEKSMELYRTGVGLLQQCKTTLDQVETELITLTEEGEVPDGANE